MDIERLNKVLYDEAKKKGACDKVMGAWTENLEVVKLIDLWLHNYEFAVKNDFPSNEFIKKEVDKDLRHHLAVYVDENIMERNKRGIVAVHGECKGMLMFDMFAVSRVYVRHKSEITISCKDFSKVFVECYEDSKVNIEAGDNAKVFVYLHGNSSEEHEGEIVVRRK